MQKINKKDFILVILVLILSFFSGYEGGQISYKNSLSYKNTNNEKISKNIISDNKTKTNITTEPASMSLSAKLAIPAVVNISLGSRNLSRFVLKNTSTNIYRPLEKRYFSLGSGIIISHDGYILTNNHVVENLGGNISVSLSNGKRFMAKTVGTDPKTDLAIIKINANDLPIIKLGDSDKAIGGDVVIAVGNPFGIGETVTMGIISAVGRSNIGIVEYENFIQTDAAINPGSSGGALVNTKGELVGINTAILTKSGGYEGIGFAIPTNMAKKVINSIMKNGRVERGWLGAGIQDTNIEIAKFLSKKLVKGVVITDIIKDSPAFMYGLKKGDIIISLNNKKIENITQVKNEVAETHAGNKIIMNIIRKGKKETISVKISKLPDNLEVFDVSNFKITAK